MHPLSLHPSVVAGSRSVVVKSVVIGSIVVVVVGSVIFGLSDPSLLDPLWLDPLSLHLLSLDSYFLLLNPLSNSHFLNVTFNTAGLLGAEEGQGAVLEEEAEAPRLPLPPRGSCGGGGAVLIRQEMEVSWREECGGFLLFLLVLLCCNDSLIGLRELWIRLAQMEAEKLKAVELAVEEEKRRVAEKRQEERRIVQQEREEAERLRKEAKEEREAGRAALQGAQQSHARQVELVNRLQVP